MLSGAVLLMPETETLHSMTLFTHMLADVCPSCVLKISGQPGDVCSRIVTAIDKQSNAELMAERLKTFIETQLSLSCVREYQHTLIQGLQQKDAMSEQALGFGS